MKVCRPPQPSQIALRCSRVHRTVTYTQNSHLVSIDTWADQGHEIMSPRRNATPEQIAAGRAVAVPAAAAVPSAVHALMHLAASTPAPPDAIMQQMQGWHEPITEVKNWHVLCIIPGFARFANALRPLLTCPKTAAEDGSSRLGDNVCKAEITVLLFKGTM